MPATAARLAAVIGRPVRHSLSPVIHAAAFADTGVDGAFTRFEVVEGGVAAAIGAMGPLGIVGFAVTMPHKQAAAEAVDQVDPAARALGAVNTVVLREDGSTFGASTDGAGFVAALAADGVDVASARVAVLGAGGAARSIVDALGRSGVAEVAVLNRTTEGAVSAAELAAAARVGTPDDVEAADIVVNATSVGMATDELPVDAALLRGGQVVVDIVYHPLDTALLRAARAVGAHPVDGLGMLIHQAVLQQELWTGRRPNPAVMRTAALAELARRQAEPHR